MLAILPSPPLCTNVERWFSPRRAGPVSITAICPAEAILPSPPLCTNAERRFSPERRLPVVESKRNDTESTTLIRGVEFKMIVSRTSSWGWLTRAYRRCFAEQWVQAGCASGYLYLLLPLMVARGVWAKRLLL